MMCAGLVCYTTLPSAAVLASSNLVKMRCCAAFVVFVFVASLDVLRVGAQYTGTGGTGVGAAQTGSTTSQAAGQPGTGGIGSTGGGVNGFAGGAGVGGPAGVGAPLFVGAAAAGGPAGVGGSLFAGRVRGGSTLPGSNGPAGAAGQGGAQFPRVTSVIQQLVAPTVTQTVTIDRFTTLTDTIFQSYGVTVTQFVVETATRPVQQALVTPVDDLVAITTAVVHRPDYITVTETKSDFRLAVRTSVTHITITHTDYNIIHVPFTITVTQTVQLTSPVVRTVINTQRQVVTDFRTLVNTVYVHGGYY